MWPVAAADDGDGKLQFYLHVGPTKTGSSTLQEDMGKKKNSADLLLEDNWVMYRFRPHTVELANCFYEHHSPCKEEYVTHFRKFVKDSAEKNHNILLSWESMWDQIEHAVPIFRHEVEEEYPYRLTVVVVYRRLYEWLSSRFFQDHRFSCPNITHGRWSDELIQERLSPIPLLSNYITNETNNLVLGLTDHPTAVAVRDGKIYAENVVVFNLHGRSSGGVDSNNNDDDMMQRFYCHILHAKKTCKAFVNDDHHHTTLENKGHTLFYERMAQQVILLLSSNGENNNKNCTEIAEAIVLEHQERNNNNNNQSSSTTINDFPVLCPPPNVLETLLQETMEFEKLLLPSTTTTDDADDLETTLRNEFHGSSSYGLKHYCDADVKKILQDEKWNHFFTELLFLEKNEDTDNEEEEGVQF